MAEAAILDVVCTDLGDFSNGWRSCGPRIARSSAIAISFWLSAMQKRWLTVRVRHRA